MLRGHPGTFDPVVKMERPYLYMVGAVRPGAGGIVPLPTLNMPVVTHTGDYFWATVTVDVANGGRGMEDLVCFPVPQWNGGTIAVVDGPEDATEMINVAEGRGVTADKYLHIVVAVDVE